MKKGDRIYIYWKDIKKYYSNSDKKEKAGPADMYTEGIFLHKKRGAYIVQDPETLSLGRLKNHPLRKPNFYTIPEGMVADIQKIK